MLTPLLFAALAVHAQTAAPVPTASGLISKMLARYASAKSLQGTIRTTQTADSATVVTDTTVAYERPSKIWLDQRQHGQELAKSKFIVSNGKQFAYMPPDNVLKVGAANILTELVQPEGRDAQTVGDLYAVVAANLPDRSPVLDTFIARPDDLRYVAAQFAQFRLTGKETIGDKSANAIEGDWRESGDVGVSAKFKLYLTDDGDLVRYVLTQIVGVPSATGVRGVPAEQVTVTTTWDANVTIDSAVKPETFALRAP